ncbi:MAG: hypothetical protein IT387_04560 [Nitrospira sp.]|nr:hypothetical protein [Nitrospira sp.]
MSSRRQSKSPAATIDPPRYVQNQRGETVEVIVSIEDYERYLRTLAKHADWETLPTYLQDAIDNLLAQEARTESGPSLPLQALLKKNGKGR